MIYRLFKTYNIQSILITVIFSFLFMLDIFLGPKIIIKENSGYFFNTILKNININPNIAKIGLFLLLNIYGVISYLIVKKIKFWKQDTFLPYFIFISIASTMFDSINPIIIGLIFYLLTVQFIIFDYPQKQNYIRIFITGVLTMINNFLNPIFILISVAYILIILTKEKSIRLLIIYLFGAINSIVLLAEFTALTNITSFKENFIYAIEHIWIISKPFFSPIDYSVIFLWSGITFISIIVIINKLNTLVIKKRYQVWRILLLIIVLIINFLLNGDYRNIILIALPVSFLLSYYFTEQSNFFKSIIFYFLIFSIFLIKFQNYF